MKIYAPQNPAARAKRATSVAVLLAVAVVVGPQAFANDAAADGAAQAVHIDSYTVSFGDTLWAIARTITPANGDVRETVMEIQKLNVMESSALRAGEQLLLPTSVD